MRTTQTSTSVHPIHQPCPDMAGCSQFNPELTRLSLQKVGELRDKHGLSKSTSQRRGGSDFRYSRDYQIQARRAYLAQGGVR
ncbi:hypothetical protein [Thaumasiovibrio sp. DFM-14]|uniref:hypothetical protein n=1 Tax=Thaumasiovibrio sp. DFM-14 TaxID=3384792 RepID=UPI0039A2A630